MLLCLNICSDHSSDGRLNLKMNSSSATGLGTPCDCIIAASMSVKGHFAPVSTHVRLLLQGVGACETFLRFLSLGSVLLMYFGKFGDAVGTAFSDKGG